MGIIRSQCPRTATSSSAPSSTTSVRRSRCCCSRAWTCSAWHGCGSPPPRSSSPVAAPVAGVPGPGSRGPAPAAGLGRGAGGDERLLLHGDRPPAARHRRCDRVPAGDRARRARRALVAQCRGARARRARRVPAHRRPAGGGAARGWRSRSSTPCSSPPTSCSPTAWQALGHHRDRRAGGGDAGRRCRGHADRRMGGDPRAGGSRRPAGRDRRRRLVVGDPVRRRPAGAQAARHGRPTR